MKKFFRYSVYFQWVFTFVCALTPLTEKQFVLPIHFPGLDESLYAYGTPYYFLVYAYELWLLFSIMYALLFYLCLVVNSIYFGTTMLEILKNKISLLGNSGTSLKKKDLSKEIVSCIKMHLKIKLFVNIIYRTFAINFIKFTYRYINTLNNLTQNIVFIEMLISAINLSFILLVFGLADSTIQVILYIIVVVYNFSAIFIFCFYGDRLTNEVFFSKISKHSLK